MNNLKPFIYVTVFFMLFYSCDNKKKKSAFYHQLLTVDSLYSTKNNSAATELLETLKQPKDSSEDLAFYNYLKAKQYVRKWQKFDTTSLNFSIFFFENAKDSLKLGYLYNYKGMSMLLENNKQEAARNNRKSEDIAEKLNDNLLKYNVYSLGSNIAKHYYDIDTYFTYALKLFNVAKELNENQKIGYAAYNLARCYYERGIKDSAENCMHNCVYVMDIFNTKDKARVLNMLGEIAEDKNDIKTAISYYKEAITLDDFSMAYNNLAQSLFRLGETEEAEKLYSKAISNKAYSKNIQLMELYANILETKGDFKSASQILKQISIEKDSILKETEIKNKILQEYQKYKIETMYSTLEKKPFSTSKIIVFFSVSLIIIILIFSILLIKLQNKRKTTFKSITENETENVNGNQNNNEIEQNNNFDINFTASKQKLRKIPNYELYLKVMKNGKNCLFTKEDEYNFVQFIKSADYNITDFINNNYQKLSNHELALVILHYILQKDKEQITNMMGISDEAFRSMKSRVDKKRII